ncbi:MAG: hypothetical protein ACT4PT_11825, partial [Methanobacteriota archaeon]
IAFARANGLAASVNQAAPTFPIAALGGCGSVDACRTYCEDVSHLAACVQHAEGLGVVPQAVLDDAKRILPFLANGTTPGGCRSEAQCKAVCRDRTKAEECLTFAVAAGFITAEQAALARRFGGFGPNGCDSEAACRAHCKEPANVDACADWAVEVGIVPANRREPAKRFFALGMAGPGGCLSWGACRAYCNEPGRFSTCIEFFYGNGIITKAEYDELAAEGGFRGPGGCATRDDCRTFCSRRENFAECDAYFGFIIRQDPGYPAACRERGYGIAQCQSYCRTAADRCGFSVAEFCRRNPSDADCQRVPAQCRDRGLYDESACRRYCETESPDKCGFGSRSGGGPPG